MSVPTNADFSERLEIFFGDASDALCRVYARLRGPAAGRVGQLMGSLTGPTCAYSQTLGATFQLVDRGPGDSLLAEATVPDPCFWSPEMPHVYAARVEWTHDGHSLASATRLLGLRPLGAHGQKLYFGGKRWVLRGVRAEGPPPVDLAAWHECGAAMIVANPDDALCQEASRLGVLLVAELTASEAREIRRLSRWPAVGVVTLPGGMHLDLHGLRHNLLLAERFAGGQPLLPQPWAHLAVCQVDEPSEAGGRIANCVIPVIAARPEATLSSLAAGRALCDRLQSDLAGSCDPAGYIV